MESYAPQKEIVNQWISNLFLILRINSCPTSLSSGSSSPPTSRPMKNSKPSTSASPGSG